MSIGDFKPGWVATVGLILLLPVFVSLGVWQMRRAEEKKAIMSQSSLRESEPVLQIQDLNRLDENIRFRRIALQGEPDAEHQFLLDNQLFNRQPGYYVMTPLRLPGSGLSVLINRGWVPVGQDRRRLPDISTSAKPVRIFGIVDKFPGVGFKLKGAEIPSAGWPSVAQVLDADRVSERLGYRVPPYQVLLIEGDMQAYPRDWKRADLNPEKNQGYALQWFSFALVLTLLYLWHGFKPKSRG